MAVSNHAERGSDGKYLSAQNGLKGEKSRTAEIVAKEHGIGRNTVKRTAKFSKGVDAAEKIESGAREAILSGKSKVPKSVIAELPEMERGEGVFASATVVLKQDRRGEGFVFKS